MGEVMSKNGKLEEQVKRCDCVLKAEDISMLQRES